MPVLLAPLGIALLCAALLAPAAAIAQAMKDDAPPSQTTCKKKQFEAVVDEAGAALRTLNRDNRPAFQAKLAKLKSLKGWDHETFLKETEPFVRDERIEAYDRESADYLNRISTMEARGAAKSASKDGPDCALLGMLRGYLTKLVTAQTAKWNYMFEKLEAELELYDAAVPEEAEGELSPKD